MIAGAMPKQVEYALIVLSEMQTASPGHLFSARELGDRHQIPFDVLSKTMQRLGHAGILRSVKGVCGGYQVIKDLSTVSLLDVIEAVSGSLSTVSCLKEGCDCPRVGSCSISDPMRIVDQKLRELYRSLDVAHLVAGRM
ncbi:MAG: Rrf2 family transcriptional regulator [Kiritimatiellaceae bacterium]|nr:Rrf2 family transcriptional regulator [Kiritimatiellaceae bacterium]